MAAPIKLRSCASLAPDIFQKVQRPEVYLMNGYTYVPGFGWYIQAYDFDGEGNVIFARYGYDQVGKEVELIAGYGGVPGMIYGWKGYGAETSWKCWVSSLPLSSKIKMHAHCTFPIRADPTHPNTQANFTFPLLSPSSLPFVLTPHLRSFASICPRKKVYPFPTPTPPQIHAHLLLSSTSHLPPIPFPCLYRRVKTSAQTFPSSG